MQGTGTAGVKERRDAELMEAERRDAEVRDAEVVEAEVREAEMREAERREAEVVKAEVWEAGWREAKLGEAELMDAELRGAEGCSLKVHFLAFSCSCVCPSREELGGIQAPHSSDQTSPQCLCWKGEGQGTSPPPTSVWRLH